MNTWVLVYLIVTGSGVATQKVPGFVTEASCETAKAKVLEMRPTLVVMAAACLKQ